MKKNEGEVPQYYIKNNHPAILEATEWDEVQFEMARREDLENKYTDEHYLHQS